MYNYLISSFVYQVRNLLNTKIYVGVSLVKVLFAKQTLELAQPDLHGPN